MEGTITDFGLHDIDASDGAVFHHTAGVGGDNMSGHLNF